MDKLSDALNGYREIPDKDMAFAPWLTESSLSCPWLVHSDIVVTRAADGTIVGNAISPAYAADFLYVKDEGAVHALPDDSYVVHSKASSSPLQPTSFVYRQVDPFDDRNSPASQFVDKTFQRRSVDDQLSLSSAMISYCASKWYRRPSASLKYVINSLAGANMLEKDLVKEATSDGLELYDVQCSVLALVYAGALSRTDHKLGPVLGPSSEMFHRASIAI